MPFLWFHEALKDPLQNFPWISLETETKISGGRSRYVIKREHIALKIITLRNTDMQWTAIPRCLDVSAKILYKRRFENWLELEWNPKLTPVLGECYIRRALRDCDIFKDGRLERFCKLLSMLATLQGEDHPICVDFITSKNPPTCGTWSPSTSSFTGDLFSMGVS